VRGDGEVIRHCFFSGISIEKIVLWVKRKVTTTCLVLVLSEASGGWRCLAEGLVED
jgi:hypothetical protein